MLARQIAIGFGIAVLFPLLVYYGVSAFHPPPKLPDVGTTECMFRAVTPDERVECDRRQRAALELHTTASKEFAWRLILAATPLGLAAIFIGAYLRSNSISVGLIVGGIITIAFGYWRYWAYIENWARFASLLVALSLLVFLGYREGTRIGSGRETG